MIVPGPGVSLVSEFLPNRKVGRGRTSKTQTREVGLARPGRVHNEGVFPKDTS